MTASSWIVSWASTQPLGQTPADVFDELIQADPLRLLERDPVRTVHAWVRGASLAAERGDSRAAFALLCASGVCEPPRVGRRRR
jgi:hypothetical protein